MRPVIEWNPAVGDPSEAIVFGFDQQLSIDGSTNCLTHTDVLELGRSGEEAEVHGRDSGRAPGFKPWIILEQRKQERWNRADREVTLPGKHSQRPRVVVADHHQSEARNLWRSSVPMWIGTKLEDAWRTLHQTIGSCAHWEWVFLRGDPTARIEAPHDRQLEVRNESRVRLAKHEPKALWIEDLDALDPAIRVRVPALELGIDDPSKGCRDILGVERATVTEAKPLLQTDFVLDGAQSHDRLGEVWDHLERSRVDGDQGGKEKPRDPKAVGIADEPRVELLGVSREDDYEHLGIALGFVGAPCADH